MPRRRRSDSPDSAKPRSNTSEGAFQRSLKRYRKDLESKGLLRPARSPDADAATRAWLKRLALAERWRRNNRAMGADRQPRELTLRQQANRFELLLDRALARGDVEAAGIYAEQLRKMDELYRAEIPGSIYECLEKLLDVRRMIKGHQVSPVLRSRRVVSHVIYLIRRERWAEVFPEGLAKCARSLSAAGHATASEMLLTVAWGLEELTGA